MDVALTPEETALVVAMRADPFTIEGKSFSSNLQYVLARDEQDNVRYHLALWAQLVFSVQHILASDRMWDVRQALAGNPYPLFVEVQDVLSVGDSASARALAFRSDLFVPIAARLSSHPDMFVRDALSRNPDLVLDGTFSAYFLHRYFPAFCEKEIVSLSGESREVLAALLPEWKGSFADLVSAAQDL